ncbi:hypothetical protein RFI_09745 [Reticulomyxa filosa]|uniref:Uncharacterized protein n=1 Tax=Reticulomyxa filosa TaxID=46433 RepID=X6NPX1_RETFI|nr:hypothetical protein RFI_09745 [Reticulomyxa filosa]|eukprot:ETO27387.1 hypothetical protein RFI_09745 [Reticulomyxa filosa]
MSSDFMSRSLDFDLNEEEQRTMPTPEPHIDVLFFFFCIKKKKLFICLLKKSKKKSGLGDVMAQMFRKHETDKERGERERDRGSKSIFSKKMHSQASHDPRTSGQGKSRSSGSSGGRGSQSSRALALSSEDMMDDQTIICNGRYDKEGWMYCSKLASESFAWKCTDSPSQRQVYRRRIWTRSAVWQPKTLYRRHRTSNGDSIQPIRSIHSCEYFMAELMSALIWHVHLMSQSNVVHSLPKELNDVTTLENNGLGQSNKHTKDLVKTAKLIEHRKRNEDAVTPVSQAKEMARATRRYGSLLVGVTKSLVVAPFRGVQKLTTDPFKAESIFQRVNNPFFVQDIHERALQLSDLVSTLKGLDFSYESFDTNPFFGFVDFFFFF